MSNAEPRQYQPVTVEDWDDEAQASIPGTRTTANVTVKGDSSSESVYPATLIHYKYDGTDSGYASKAPTVSSMASSRHRRTSELKIDTAIVTERERKPYAMAAAARDAQQRQATQPTKEKETQAASQPVKKPFCHKQGICWVCDQYGFHFDLKNPPKDLHKMVAAAAKPPTPAPLSQVPPKPAPKPKAEDIPVPRPTARRMSSAQSRPASMYAGMPVQTPYAQYPAMHPGWSVPTPTQGVAYAAYPFVAPSTPVAYVPAQPQQLYYDPPAVFDDFAAQPTNPVRRASIATKQRPLLEKKPSRMNTMVERPVSRDQRPQITSHRSARSIDADNKAMPPPPRPQPATTVNTARPRPGRSNTYHTSVPAITHSMCMVSSDEEDDYLDPQALVTYGKPPVSPRRPPSSFKAPILEGVAERPVMPKSKSYHTGPTTTHVAGMPRRRTTESIPTTTVHEQQKEAAAEAYMRKRGSMPVELTAENLLALKNIVPRHVSDQRSESGSTASHVTHHSSSKDSSSGGRGHPPTSSGSALGHNKRTSMNINVNGLKFAITDDGNARADAPPVKLDLGAIQISMGGRDKENIDYRPKAGQTQLECTPSMPSRLSRRSLTSGSLVSAATSGQRREKDEILALEGQREYVRRESYVDEDERELLRRTSAKSSRQPSRNPSSVRQAMDGDLPIRPRAASKRSSVDYSQLRREEGVM